VYSEPAYVAPSISEHTVELQYEVQRLQREIDDLRQQQSAAAVQPPPPTIPQPAPAAAPEQRPALPTVLIFRDGRRMMIQNYAIVGQTLWVLEERSSTRIAVSELDLEKTQTENRTEGVRFPLPAR